MKEKHIQLSRFLSLILRHKPEVVGLNLDSQGYIPIKELINGINTNSKYFIDEEILDEIVDTDNKQRYSYDSDKSKIKANQGHSVEVDLDFQVCQPPNVLYHGTSEKYLNLIMNEGLKKQNRLYVHLSDNIETAKDVGSRRGKPAILSINSKQMYKDGYKFYKSENNVWLIDKVNKEYLKVIEL